MALKNWIKQNRFKLQAGAFSAGVLAPFLLYAALQAGNGWLAGVSFFLLAAVMVAMLAVG